MKQPGASRALLLGTHGPPIGEPGHLIVPSVGGRMRMTGVPPNPRMNTDAQTAALRLLFLSSQQLLLVRKTKRR